MSELELLYLILVLLYGWECACWQPRGSVAVLTWLGKRWRTVFPSGLLGNQRGGFVFAPPLPPLGFLISGTPLPLCLSPDGMMAAVPASLDPGLRWIFSGANLRFDDIREIKADGRKLCINGKTFLKAASPDFTAKLARRIQKLKNFKPADRDKLIKKTLEESFDTSALIRRWTEFLELSRHMRRLTNGLFAHLFFVIPAVIWTVGLRLSWHALLAVLLSLTIAIAVLFRRAHHGLYPEAEDERFSHFLVVLLSPVSAIRAQDLLSRPLLESFHPLAIAFEFCPRAESLQLAEKFWRRITFDCPGAGHSNPNARAIQEFSMKALRTECDAFLKRNGVNGSDLIQAPAPADQTCRAYCPICLAQFTTASGICADCGGVELIPFPVQDTGR